MYGVNKLYRNGPFSIVDNHQIRLYSYRLHTIYEKPPTSKYMGKIFLCKYLAKFDFGQYHLLTNEHHCLKGVVCVRESAR